MNAIIQNLKDQPYLLLHGNFKGKQELKESFIRFLCQPLDYRLEFKQSNFGLDKVGFDGYSFPGQIDSVNQAYDDHLHSMVLSEFLPFDKYPQEFHEYLNTHFVETLQKIKVELGWDELLTEMGLTDKMGFSASINYYPKKSQSTGVEGPRLTQHVDGSLLTVFPYGLDEGLYYENNNTWQKWPATKKAVCFPGYMNEVIDSPLKPLNHKLEWSEKDEERFAFAFFIVPKPEIQIEGKFGEVIDTYQYYQNYLDLFN